MKCSKTHQVKEVVVNVTDSQVMLAKQFANETYFERYQHRAEKEPGLTLKKCKQDIFNGTISEFIAKNALEIMGFSISDVDLRDLPINGRSFEADLVERNKGYRFHVKGADGNSPFAPSHLFSLTDPLLHTPDKNDYILSVTYIEDNNIYSGYINGCYKATDILENDLYDEPIKEQKKKAIYIRSEENRKNVEDLLTSSQLFSIL